MVSLSRDLLAPGLRPAHVEALIAGEAVDHRRRAAAERELVGLVGDGQARVVGDVLAQRQLAVDVKAGHRLAGAVLRDQRVGLGLELLVVGRAEPAGRAEQVAVAVVLAALVVEAVADLVADHRADGAVVHRIVRTGIEERRLQHRGREHDFVHLGVVVGVDGLRRHAPLAAIDRLAELVEVALVLEQLAPASRCRQDRPCGS